MLISITEQCRMGCIHCMDDAKKNGNHMTMDTFKQAVNFFNDHNALCMIITGGEPTENPLCLDMVKHALENTHSTFIDTNITLATNGMNISGNKEYQDELLRLFNKYGKRFMIQLTHVIQYYPIDVDFSEPFFSHPNVVLCTEIEAMYPQGRALINNLPSDAKASKCFNIRSVVRQHKNLAMGIVALAMRGKFCTPRVNWDGGIKLGESRLCPTVANIWDKEEDVIKNICNFRCAGCNHINSKLDRRYLEAIGEV